MRRKSRHMGYRRILTHRYRPLVVRIFVILAVLTLRDVLMLALSLLVRFW